MQGVACIAKGRDMVRTGYVCCREKSDCRRPRGEKGKKSRPKECPPEGMDERSLGEGRGREGKEEEGRERNF